MKAIAVANAPVGAQARTSAAPRALLIWLIPALYQLSIPAIFSSSELSRTNVVLGGGLLALAIAWSVAGPFAGWLALNYLDEHEFDRAQNRLVVYGALFAAVTPPLFTFMRKFTTHELLAWYVVMFVVALATLLPASEISHVLSMEKFRYVHASSAIVLGVFAIAHVFNHSLAIVSLGTHTAVLHALRIVYRQSLGQVILVAAVAVQVLTGVTMVWNYSLRRASPLRNLQLISGVYLAVFLASHLLTVFTIRHQGIDTDFAWASHAPAGLLGSLSSVSLLPRYSLAVLAVFVHLACQARWNLARVMSVSAARKTSFGVAALGGVLTVVITLAACGVHLMK